MTAARAPMGKLDADDIARAKAVPVESVVAHLKLKRQRLYLIGPCPGCGGDDRFNVSIRKQRFYCRQCDAKGDVIALAMLVHDCDFPSALRILIGEGSSHPKPAPQPVATKEQDEAYARRQRRKAQWLWGKAEQAIGTIVEDYLRHRGYVGRIPKTIRFLPADSKYPPAMVASFGFAYELEPGLIDIHDNDVEGVHVTRLLPDGSDRERGDQAKITIGVGFTAPIVLAPPNDQLGLAITEGIEKGLAIHAVAGLGVWVAGSAGRMPALADVVPDHVECVTILVDGDDAGRRHSTELARRLAARGIEVLMRESST
jgi:Toprim domain/CHC2 zinc finger